MRTTPRGALLFQLKASVQNMKGNAFGLFPTPTTSEQKYRLKGNSQASKSLEAQARQIGGKLNPNFVEHLMGFPQDWTKIE